MELKMNMAVMKQIPSFVIVRFTYVVRLYPSQKGCLIKFLEGTFVPLISHHQTIKALIRIVDPTC